MAAKVMFVIFRRSDLTRDQCLDQWKGERHGALVRKTPGLRKWTQTTSFPKRESVRLAASASYGSTTWMPCKPV